MILFSHEIVVTTQFNENSWFYPPIYGKWLALNNSIKTKEEEILWNLCE